MSRSRKSADMSMTLICGIGGKHRRGDLLRRAMRQAAEDGVEPAPVGLLPFDQFWQVEMAKCGKTSAIALPACVLAVSAAISMFGCRAGEAHKVGAGVAGSAENADLVLRLITSLLLTSS